MPMQMPKGKANVAFTGKVVKSETGKMYTIRGR